MSHTAITELLIEMATKISKNCKEQHQAGFTFWATFLLSSLERFGVYICTATNTEHFDKVKKTPKTVQTSTTRNTVNCF